MQNTLPSNCGLRPPQLTSYERSGGLPPSGWGQQCDLGVKSFLLIKSPGLDGILSALFQWGLEIILVHLVQILRA